MILVGKKLASEVRRGNTGDPNGIAIVPTPNLIEVENAGEASINLRLGRWFVTMRLSNETHVDAVYDPKNSVSKISKSYFVPFGEVFVLHPNRFVLASTLEWVRLPSTLAA